MFQTIAQHRVSYSRASILQTILAWHETAKQRRALLRLDEAGLKDVGLTRDQVIAETNRPFWV